MSSWFALPLACLPCTGVVAQADSATWTCSPWLEVNIGSYSPSGLVGLGFGVPTCRYVTAALAGGFGGSEGKHISLGLEGTALSWGRNDLGPFAYWTWTIGKQNDTYGSPRYSTTTSPGEMVKAGVSYAGGGPRTRFCLRGGYAWYVEQPVTKDASGAIGLAEPDGTLNGRPVINFSVRFLLGSGRR